MEKADSKDTFSACVIKKGETSEKAEAHGVYIAKCFDKNGKLKWEDISENVVTTQGKNHALDNYLAGIAYTATFYLGLISSVSYVGPATSDTATQINGTNQWKEAGSTNAPNYSESFRQTATFGAAATGGSKTISVAATFTMSGAGTIKGAFLTNSNVKGGVAGILYSAGTFAGGDKVVTASDIVQISYTASL